MLGAIGKADICVYLFARVCVCATEFLSGVGLFHFITVFEIFAGCDVSHHFVVRYKKVAATVLLILTRWPGCVCSGPCRRRRKRSKCVANAVERDKEKKGTSRGGWAQQREKKTRDVSDTVEKVALLLALYQSWCSVMFGDRNKAPALRTVLYLRGMGYAYLSGYFDISVFLI